MTANPPLWNRFGRIVLITEPGSIPPPAPLARIGSVGDLIQAVIETYPPDLRRAVRIECGETYLGIEAIGWAYGRAAARPGAWGRPRRAGPHRLGSAAMEPEPRWSVENRWSPSRRKG